DQQQGIDLIFESVRLTLLQQLLDLGFRRFLLLEFRLQRLPAALELAAGDDITIDFSHDLFDYLHLGRGKGAENGQKYCHYSGNHIQPIIQQYAGRARGYVGTLVAIGFPGWSLQRSPVESSILGSRCVASTQHMILHVNTPSQFFTKHLQTADSTATYV